MHKKHRTTRKKMKGAGFFDTLSNWGSSLKQKTSSLWNQTQNAASGLTSSFSNSSSPNYSTYPNYSSSPNYSTYPNYSSSPRSYNQPMNTPYPSTTPRYTPTNYGGKRRIKRVLKGGFKDNTPTTGLVTTAAPFSGPTAQPHKWLGGKSRRKNKGKKMNTRRRH